MIGLLDNTMCTAMHDPEDPEDKNPPKDAAAFLRRVWRQEPCRKPATHETIFGRRCPECLEKLKESLRDPHTTINVIAGSIPSEEKINSMIRRLATATAASIKPIKPEDES